MPINLSNPETQPAITIAKIKSINIDTDGSVGIDIVKGYTVSNIFTELKRERIRLEGQDFIALAETMPDETKNLYENIKTIVYNKLIEKGLISGTVV